MAIRFAKEQDTDAVSDLIDELLACSLQSDNKQSPISKNNDERKKLFIELLNRDDTKFFVVEEAKELVAFAELIIIPNLRRGKLYGQIKNFIVTERMRGKGIGGRLVKKIKDYCKKQGIVKIDLLSGFELTDAHIFYEKQGAMLIGKWYRFNI